MIYKILLSIFCFSYALPTYASNIDRSSSVVKIFNYSVQSDYYTPWKMHQQNTSTGSGVIINNNFILTAAHVVSNSIFLEVQKNLDSKKYFAEVKWIAHDADLALLQVREKDFFINTSQTSIGFLPKRQDSVSVYGYPEGGAQISITKGIVSRIEQTIYAHSTVDLLSIQIDAAINPGNSGGPAFNNNGEIVGIAMQSLLSSNSIGYIVPSPIIKHFLKDIEDGIYDGFPDDGLYIQPMENTDLQAHYNMNGRTGVLVTSVIINSSSYNHVHKGDVLLEIDGYSISNDNSLKTKNLQKIASNHIVQQHFIGEHINLKILRNSKEMTLKIPLKKFIRKIPLEHEKKPRYYIYGGFIFTPLTQNYLESWGENWYEKAPLDFIQAFDKTDVQNNPVQEFVVLQSVLHNKVNAGYSPYNLIVSKINGFHIHSLKELVQQIKTSKEEVVIETSRGKIFIINTKKAKASEPTVLRAHGIKHKSHLDINL